MEEKDSTTEQPEEKKPISHIKVNREACISVGSCEAIAPNVFGLDAEGIAFVKDKDADTLENVLEAAKSCPVNAIYVYDAEGNKLWPQ